MDDKIKRALNLAVLVPIAGLLGSGIVGTIAIPEISRGVGDNEKIMAFTWVMFAVAVIFGATLTWAGRLLAKTSLVAQVPTLRSSYAFTVVMQFVWLSVNFLAFVGFLSAFNIAYTNWNYEYAPVHVTGWTALPIALYGLLLLAQALVFLDFNSRTVVPKAVVRVSAQV